MGVIDIIILCCFLPAFYFGIKNGLVRQLVAVAVLYFGITLSLRFSEPVAAWIIEHVHMTEFWAKTVSFIVVFLVISLLLGLLGRVIEKIIQISLLGWLNKLLGIVASLFVIALAVSTIVYFVDQANNTLDFIPKEKLEESRFYPWMIEFAKSIFPRFKELAHAVQPA